MERSRLGERRGRKRMEDGGGKTEENDSQLRPDSFSQAKAFREKEIHFDDMLAKTLQGSTPASDNIQNSLKSTTSKPLPHIEGTEKHSSAAHSAPFPILTDDFLVSIFSKPTMVSPVTPSRYTTRHAKMVARQRATLRHMSPQGSEDNNLAASPMTPLEAMRRDSVHAPSAYYRRQRTTMSHNNVNLNSASAHQSEETRSGVPGSTHLEAAIGHPAPISPTPAAAITSGREHVPLGEATAASNVFEDKPEESANNQEQKNVHLGQSLPFNLTEMACLQDDETSGHNKVESLEVNPASVIVCGYRVKEEFAPILRAVLFKHGDIAANCSLQTMQSRSSFLEILCGIVQKLQSTNLSLLKSVDIDSMLAVVVDLKLVRVEVGWLYQRLIEIVDATKLVKQIATLKEEQKKRVCLMEETQKELEALQQKVHSAEDKLATLKAEADKFNETISDANNKVWRLYQRSLVAGLL